MKLSKSGEDGEKALLVLESGVRFHTTQVRQHKYLALCHVFLDKFPLTGHLIVLDQSKVNI